MTFPDFEDKAWNDRRIALRENVATAINELVQHMGGGMLVEFPMTVNGIIYTLRMERASDGRRIN